MSLRIGGLCPLLQVFDMPTSLRFYRDVLGFTPASPVPEDGQCDWVLLELRGSELMLNTAYETQDRPTSPDARRVEAHRDTALFFDCADVDDAYQELRDGGLAVDPPVLRDYGMKQLYILDPDGFEICLQHPVRESQASGEAL